MITRDVHTSRTSRYFAEGAAKCKCAQRFSLAPTFADLGEAYTPIEKWPEILVIREGG